MNAEINQLFADYLKMTEDKGAAASLVLATIMLRQQIKTSDPDVGLTVVEVAMRLKCSRDTVYRLCKSGKLPHSRIGVGRGGIRIRLDDLLLASQKPSLSPFDDMAAMAAKRRRHLGL